MQYPQRNIAIIDETGKLSFERLVQIADAIQIQMNEHVLPQWQVAAIVKAFRTEAEAPREWWTAKVLNEIVEGNTLNGIHWFTGTGTEKKAYAKARYTSIFSSTFFENDLTKVISEEIIEMCIDPFAELKLKGINPDPNSQDGQEVEYLVELGDPVQALQNGYFIGDVFVTNFIFPSYFYATKQEGIKYDYLGQFTEPKQLGEGGYQIYQRAGEWYQAWKINGIKYYIKQGGALPDPNADNVKITIGFLIIAFFVMGYLVIKNIFFNKNNS